MAHLPDPSHLRTVLISLMPLIGLVRLYTKWRDKKREELPMGAALTDAWIRAEVKRGNRPRAMRAYRELHHVGAPEAREAIDAIEVDLRGR